MRYASVGCVLEQHEVRSQTRRLRGGAPNDVHTADEGAMTILRKPPKIDDALERVATTALSVASQLNVSEPGERQSSPLLSFADFTDYITADRCVL